MQLSEKSGSAHLTYCTNIHAGESWPDVREKLEQFLPSIKAEVAPGRPFGLGLRLSAAASATLREPAEFEAFSSFMQEGGYYVFTLNGFPYGTFHGARVKEGAYLPDWSAPDRLAYTNQLGDLLAEMLPDGQVGSVSTVPLTFKPWAEGRIEAITDNLLRHAAHLVELRERTGKTIVLALEPEPYCLLETIDETVGYFNERLFGSAAVARLGQLTGRSPSDTESDLRRHLGVCYDVCHAAVEFEDAARSIAQLRGAGIGIAKLQLSSAMKLARVGAEDAVRLRAFDEPVYLHQVVESGEGGVKRYIDLPEALAEIDAALGKEWRIHFHVPIFLDELVEFSTTQSFLREVLALHGEEAISPHLEVETYTWDVLPEHYRNVPVSAAIARELSWVLEQLAEE